MSTRSVPEWLGDLGGVARYGSLARLADRTSIDAAVQSGLVIRHARGLYALPGVDDAVRLAAQVGGVLSLTSAALQHGWAVKRVPDRPRVTVGRGRRVGDTRSQVYQHWADLAPHEFADGVTTPEVTLLQCLRGLPEDEGLAVADSALRESGCHQLFARVAEQARGPGSPRVRRVAAAATGLAANPFESCLRAICLTVPGLSVEPQVEVRHGPFRARPDLLDHRLRVVCEADSFAWHGGRAASASDARRYNRLVVNGWLVLRFSYEDVMFHPEEVQKMLLAAVALAGVLVEVAPWQRRTA